MRGLLGLDQHARRERPWCEVARRERAERLDLLGCGGPGGGGGPGCSTDRLPYAHGLGKSRWNATDGGAWRAAAVAACWKLTPFGPKVTVEVVEALHTAGALPPRWLRAEALRNLGNTRAMKEDHTEAWVRLLKMAKGAEEAPHRPPEEAPPDHRPPEDPYW